jgi:cell filamentation protein, protein adenylyltransferase
VDAQQTLKESVAAKKAQLDALRPLAGGALLGLQKAYDVELTYSSNALEGNTLTLRETAEVIEHGITVGGKTLREHLEAADHYDAVIWMRELAAGATPLGETTVCDLHRRIVLRSQPLMAGIYSSDPRRVAGSRATFPNPAKLPELMRAFGEWLRQAGAAPLSAFEAHFKLASIHPFPDGNGRTARLLMNLMLLRGGYPPVAVRPEDRKTYLDALEEASLSGDLRPFHDFMHRRLDATLTDYVKALHDALPDSERR